MSIVRHHAEWQALVEVTGPFLSFPVLCAVFPQGLDQPDDESAVRRDLRQARREWEEAADDPAIHRAWIAFVLEHALDWQASDRREGPGLPPGCTLRVSEHQTTLTPDMALVGPARGGGSPPVHMLVSVLPRSQRLERPIAGEPWKASPTTRMTQLLLGTGVRLGLVSNGEDWLLVHAVSGETAGTVAWQAGLWSEEPLALRAFRTLVGRRRQVAVREDETLVALYARSAADQHEVTDQLGRQVRRAVEVLVQTLDRLDRASRRTLLADVSEATVYEAVVTVMMRLVFLLTAEERGLLLLGDRLYDAHYAVSTLREQLRATADAHGQEVLERRHGAWARLLATFRLVHAGSDHPDLHLPGHGGSLFDPVAVKSGWPA